MPVGTITEFVVSDPSTVCQFVCGRKGVLSSVNPIASFDQPSVSLPDERSTVIFGDGVPMNRDLGADRLRHRIPN